MKSFQELDKLDYTNSWMRYLNGEAVIHISPLELEMELSFKIQHQKSIFSYLKKHFYDEEYIHLTIPDDFEGYFL